MGISEFKTVEYKDQQLYFLDQSLLPNETKYLEADVVEDVYKAIQRLQVRGAPAIGVAAGYGMFIAARNEYDAEGTLDDLDEKGEYLISARPTAVNLSWAVKRQLRVYHQAKAAGSDPEAILDRLLTEAEAIRKEDEDSCYHMAENGLTLLRPGMGILTHCNAGALATVGYGTALGPLHLGQERGYDFHVFADETRPLLQGARLTAWELQQSGVDVTVICDNMASIVMKKGWVDAVVVGCDRMAANGDGANKIGTSGVAILAKEYGIPFYMFVPTSTIDMNTETGDDIVIEERQGEEIREMWYEKPMAPAGVRFYNPAFDVTDHRYITAVVTEKGILRPPYNESLAALMEAENV